MIKKDSYIAINDLNMYKKLAWQFSSTGEDIKSWEKNSLEVVKPVRQYI